MAAVKTIFLTGASGVIGRALVAELEGQRVIGLAHANTELPALDETVEGDLSLPRFGLDRDRWRELAARVDAVVHSGALTTWGLPRERYSAVNVEGTRQAIELARLAEAPLHLIGTCFVHALERGHRADLAEDNVVVPYIVSKLEAEQLLASSGIPHSVFRPTNIVGDSRSGASSEPQIVQVMSDWILRGKAPFFPAHEGNRVDVVPLDVVAAAIARAVLAEDLGGPHWLTYGEEAMSVDTALAVLLDHAHESGREIELAPVVDPGKGLPFPLEQVPAMSRVFLKVLIDVGEVTHACGGVLPTSLPWLRERYDIPPVSDAEAYRRSLRYWATARGRAQAAAVEAA